MSFSVDTFNFAIIQLDLITIHKWYSPKEFNESTPMRFDIKEY